MGEPKLLLPWRGVPLVRHIAQTALQSQLDELVIVVGYESAQVVAALVGLPVRVVENEAFRDGQSTSLHVGVAALNPETDALVVLLADQPKLESRTIDALITTYRQHQPLIVAPRHAGRRGNPVLFDRTLIPQLAEISGDQGARRVIAEHISELHLVDVDDDGVLIDIDTPEMYRQLLKRDQSEQLGTA